MSDVRRAIERLRRDGVTGLGRAVSRVARRRLFESVGTYTPVYKLSLWWDGASLSPADPDASVVPRNEALETEEAYREVVAHLDELGLPTHPDDPKNWDHLSALATILDETDETARILDAGGAEYSPLADWLYLYDYEDLHVLNLAFDDTVQRGPITYCPGDITDTDYPDNHFDVVTSLSVIEHGVDTDAFLQESARLLKPGGRLIVSTDFWETELDSEDVREYGTTWDPFTPAEMRDMLTTATDYGFAEPTDLSLTTDERTVEWQGEQFTFVVCELVFDPCGVPRSVERSNLMTPPVSHWGMFGGVKRLVKRYGPDPVLRAIRPLYRKYRLLADPKHARQYAQFLGDKLGVVGPSSIYDEDYVEKHFSWQDDAEIVAEVVRSEFDPERVLDIGCGIGLHMKPLQDAGVEVHGLEGNATAIENAVAPKSTITQFDLREPFHPEQTYDLTICFEVLEHIPQRFDSTVVETIARTSDTTVVSTPAPGKYDFFTRLTNHHVNEQPRSYWIDQFADAGMEYREDTVERLRAEMYENGVEDADWIPQHLFVFKRID